jgi:hypothetical protein
MNCATNLDYRRIVKRRIIRRRGLLVHLERIYGILFFRLDVILIYTPPVLEGFI